jgi:glyoxylase-like metal-dependent hydrolase (beta-lactamase superfamily II)
MEAYRLAPDPKQVEVLAKILRLRSLPLLAIAQNKWAPQPSSMDFGDWSIRAFALQSSSGFHSNTYLVWRPASGEAVLVDPGFEPEKIKEAIAALGLKLRYIAVTHGHYDHVGAAAYLASCYTVPIAFGEPDRHLLEKDADIGLFRFVEEGDRLEVGDSQVLEAYGHTPGGRCYLLNGACFVGDTLFAGSIGRTFGGPPDYPKHLETLSRILDLDPATALFPGHGPATTVREEREFNPFYP